MIVYELLSIAILLQKHFQLQQYIKKVSWIVVVLKQFAIYNSAYKSRE